MNAYRQGRIHVMERMCDTCIFRAGNLIHLDAGRLESMVSQAVERDTAIICHSTLKDDNAVCRGFFDSYFTAPLRLARAMNIIEFDSAEGRHP